MHCPSPVAPAPQGWQVCVVWSQIWPLAVQSAEVAQLPATHAPPTQTWFGPQALAVHCWVLVHATHWRLGLQIRLGEVQLVATRHWPGTQTLFSQKYPAP
jgi:hypothetical protein